MSEGVLPQSNLPNESVQWARQFGRVSGEQARDIQRLTLNQEMSNRAMAGQMGVIGQQLADISSQQLEIVALLSRLQNASEVYSKEEATVSTGDGWAPAPPSVTASSLSGRFRVSVFGGAAGATTFFTFSAPGFPRDRILGGSASAIVSRVGGTGGASSLNTVYGSWVVTLDPGVEHTFTAQAKGTTSFSATQGLGIQVEPLL